MISAATDRVLHVANGTSTTRKIQAARIPGACSIWADPLYDGPVPGVLSDGELLDVRAAFLAGPGDFDPLNDLREWRARIERHDTNDELILWFEHDLFDQLNLIQLLTWIGERLPPSKPVSLICIRSFPGHREFKGLGELTTGELASLIESRRRVTRPQYEVARRAWQLFREPTPQALDQFRHDDSSPLPYLAGAFGRFLQEYPWTTDGLGRTERRLLELADGGGEVALQDVFPRLHDGEQVYYVTDGSLADMAERLSRTTPPLLRVDPSDAREGHVLRATVALTEAGRAVLAGQLDRVTTCGIDRWLGGVHLQGRRGLWRWDDAQQQVVRV